MKPRAAAGADGRDGAAREVGPAGITGAVPPESLLEAEELLVALAAVFAPAGAAAWRAGAGARGEPPGVEDRYRILVEQIPAVVFMAYLEHGIGEAYVSPQIEAILGFTQEEWLNDPVRWYERIHPEDKGRWSVEAARMFLTGEPLRSVYRVLARDGRVVWFDCHAKMVRYEDGRPWFVHGVAFDVTNRKRAEEALRRREEELRALSASLLSVQDEERRRIARELHDSTAQNLAGLAMNLSLLMKAAAGDPGLRRVLSDSLALAEQCAREVRNLSYLLHPPLLDDLGLAPALKSYIAGFNQRTGIDVELDVPPGLGRLPPEVETALFRIVQEGLTNVHRHSGSSRAAIRIALTDSQVRLTVEDEGGGAAPRAGDDGAAVRLGVGIPGMRERAQQLGGHMEIASGPRGTTVTVTLPRRCDR